MQDLRGEQILDRGAVEGVMAKTFMSHVFSYMAAALVITGVIAYWFGSNPENVRFMYGETGLNMIGWIVMLAPLGFVLAMGGLMKRLSSPMMLLLFIAYAALMGLSLSFIFLAFAKSAIYSAFFTCAAMFTIMAIAGWTTNMDLTKFGSILYMGVIGLIVASVVNGFFIESEGADWLISIFGVLIFTGLTAYDVQKLKRIGSGVEVRSESGTKLAMWGAVSLYLDFVNLFLFLLRLFGGRD